MAWCKASFAKEEWMIESDSTDSMVVDECSSFRAKF